MGILEKIPSTCTCVGFVGLFSFQEQDRACIYLVSGYELYLLQVEHEKIKFISSSGHVVFCLLHEHINDDVFDDFLKISVDFPKLFRR